jgi:CRP-like cAMP-binding protein
MKSTFVQKLNYGADLTAEDCTQLEAIASRWRSVPAHRDVIQEGDDPSNVHLVLEGFACRYKILENGKRQIMAVFVPGDLCDLHVHILGEMGASLRGINASNPRFRGESDRPSRIGRT